MIRNLFGGASKCRTVDVCDIFGDNSGKALYRLDGNTNDESGNYHGTETAITYGGGVYERSAVFNGTSSKIDSNVPASLFATTNNFTVSFLFKKNTATTCSIIGNISGVTPSYAGWGIGSNSAGNISYGFINTADGAQPSYALGAVIGAWYHISMTFTTSTKISILYVNGVQVGTNTNTGIISPTQTLDFGYFRRDNSNWLNGSIDQVRIFNRAITATEVATLYAECAPTSTVDDINPFEDGSLKALYKFNGDATDATGTYNGTATNVTYSAGKFGNCAVFNGSAQVLVSSFISNTTDNTDFTVSSFIKFTTLPDATYYKTILGLATAGLTPLFRILVYYVSAGQFRIATARGFGGNFYTSSSYPTVSFSATTADFVHITAVYRKSDKSVLIYANGNYISTQTLNSSSAVANSASLLIGRASIDGTVDAYSLNGSIDQLRIFNKALTPMEVASLYNETTPLEEPMHSLVDPFKDGSGKALYRLDGNALDESGNYHGTETAITYGAGRFGRAGVFNGSSSVIAIGAGITAFKTTNHTMSMWVYTAVTLTNSQIFNNNTKGVASGDSNNSGSSIKVDSGYPVVLYNVLNNETTTNSDGIVSTSYIVYNKSSTLLPLNQWVHIVGVVSGNSSALYINGVLDCTITSSQTIRYSTLDDNVSIGVLKYDAANYNYFNGSIDQVRFFNRAITASEVQTLFTEI